MTIRRIAARPERNSQDLWSSVSCGMSVTACRFVGLFDEDAVLELRAGSDQRDELGGIDGTPAVLCPSMSPMPEEGLEPPTRGL